MKRITILLVLALVALAGCSGIQATPKMEAQIATNAAEATARLATEQTKESATAGIATNAKVFANYYDNATVNVFAYWFDARKQIWCNATYYTLIKKTKVASETIDKNTKADDKYDEPTIKALYIEENKWLQQVNDGLKGTDIQR